MGDVIRLHARTTSAGRGTCDGHSAPAGQRSENQPITSSYLRAVKVFPSSSSRSKKRQSPAAKRPIVAKLTERAAPYAEAQAMRLERISDSIAPTHSRKIPTAQDISVGKFRLDTAPDKSDKSAMPSVERIRARIKGAMDKAGEGPVWLALELGLERNHIRDFLAGKKRSLRPEALMAVSDRYDIPFNELLITKEKKTRATA